MIYKELAKFKNIKYYDEPHKYFIGEQELTSGTTFIGQFKNKFDAPMMAKASGKKKGIDPEVLLAEWDYKRDFSSMKGTMVHNFAENYWGNKVFPYNDEAIINRFGEDVIKERYEECVRMFKEFYSEASKSLVPIAMELVIGDAELGIGGMVDGLFWNDKMGELQIWDYKTNRQIRTQSEYKKRFKAPINFIQECEFEAYSLQLNLYKYIIEKNTNLKIGRLYLVWITEENEKFEVIECKDYMSAIELLIKK
jgi:hypothetical protein